MCGSCVHISWTCLKFTFGVLFSHALCGLLFLLVTTSVEGYVFELGAKSCKYGAEVMNKDECKMACDELKLVKGVLMNNSPCYKSGKARCRQDGRHGSKASLICKIGGKRFNQSISIP